jgi:hypothetical protein
MIEEPGATTLGYLPLGGEAMSVEALSWVFQHSESSLGSRHVLLSIANHAKSDGTGAWPSVPTIARESRLSVRQVQRCFTVLVNLGELRLSKETGPHGCNLYSLPKMRGVKLSPGERHPVTEGVTFTTEKGAKMSPEPKSIEPSIKTKTDALLESFPEDDVGTLRCMVCRRAVTPSRAAMKQHLQICAKESVSRA